MNTLLARTLLVTSAVLATSAVAYANPQTVALSVAPALSSGSPVEINQITFAGTKLQENNMLPGHIMVSFTDENVKPATDVMIGLVDGENRTIEQYDETGTFTQGTEVVRQLPFDRVLDRQLVGAEVEEVTFADGTSWVKPAAIAPLSRRQASSLDDGSVRNATTPAHTNPSSIQNVQTPAVSHEHTLELPYPGFDGNPNN